jgi:hypothetical protein
MLITHLDVAGIEGDSNSSAAYYPQFLTHLMQEIRNRISPNTQQAGFWPNSGGATGPAQGTAWPPSVPAEVGGPRFWNRAVGGYQTSDVAAQIATDLAVQPATTAVFIAIGVNDAFHGVAPATTSSNLKTCLDAVVAAGITKCMVIGPLCIGEKTDGTNGHDADIIATNNAMATRTALYPSFDYVNLRTDVFDVWEPILNVPSPGQFNGPLTLLDPVGNAAHYNPTGIRFCVETCLRKITIS